MDKVENITLLRSSLQYLCIYIYLTMGVFKRYFTHARVKFVKRFQKK